MEFFLLALWPNESLQLEHLWHCSGCHLSPTCAIFYLVRLLEIGLHMHYGGASRGLACEGWTLYAHSFWPDCWPWGTSFVFLFDQDQRQSSCPSLSPKAPFSSISLLVSEIFPPIMYHPLPWATAMPMGVSFLFAVIAHSGICFSAFFPHQHWAHELKHHVRGKRWLSWERTSGNRVSDPDPRGL